LDDVAKLVVSQFPGVRYLSKFYINDNVDNPVVAEYKKYIDALYSVISDGHYQFVYTHLLLPHPPFFYDASTNDFMDPVTDEKYYDDALELVDRTIGDVRSKLDAQGVWENALIIFTADHGAGGNIPLLIQFPGNRKPLQNENPVFAPRLREMLKLYQTGKIRNAAEMISFFETGKHLTSRD
jgi:arylsulfatase A-like enzyme